jgi:hypothetical protein
MERGRPDSYLWPKGTGAALEAATRQPFPHESLSLEITDEGARCTWLEQKGLRVDFELRESGGTFAIVKLTVEGEWIDSKVMRSIPTGHLLEVALARLAHERVMDTARSMFGVSRRPQGQIELADRAASSASKRGRPPLTDKYLHEVAGIYFDLCERFGTRGSLARLAEALSRDAGQQSLSRDAARDLVRKARRRGFLEPTKQGRGSAALGETFFQFESMEETQ